MPPPPGCFCFLTAFNATKSILIAVTSSSLGSGNGVWLREYPSAHSDWVYGLGLVILAICTSVPESIVSVHRVAVGVSRGWDTGHGKRSLGIRVDAMAFTESHAHQCRTPCLCPLSFTSQNLPMMVMVTQAHRTGGLAI